MTKTDFLSWVKIWGERLPSKHYCLNDADAFQQFDPKLADLLRANYKAYDDITAYCKSKLDKSGQ
jgi:hypothetical protein